MLTMTVPDFKKFGVNTYRSKVTQRGETVILAHRRWLAVVALSFLGAIVAFFFIVPMIMKGNYTLTLERVFGIPLFFILEAGAIAYALYREELFFDFGGRYYRLRKGFLWNIKEFRGFFNDIVAVVVMEDHIYSKETRRNYTIFDISIECRKESPAFGIWQAQSREQADYISRTLANAFGCKVIWEKSKDVMLEEKLRNKLS
jgi:hypothetical protein